MIIPRPQKIKSLNHRISFTEFLLSGDFVEFADNYLSVFLPKLSVQNENSGLKIFLNKTNGYSENGYSIKSNDKIAIEFSTREGLRNALSSLIQLITKEDNNYYFEVAEINDFSDCKYRSVMIDLARGLPDVERLKEDLRRLALAKCNNVHFHLMDEMGICYKSDVFTSTDDIRGTERYSKEIIKDLVAYCDSLCINVVPEIEIPAHGHYLLNSHSELKCDTDIENQSTWCVCAGNEKTYEFYDALIKEVSSLFNGEFLHIGGDELYFNDFPDWNCFCHWDSCRVCRKVMQENSMRDKFDLYAYMVTKMNNIVKKYGKTMIMWNDEIDLSVPCNIPKDIIMQFWRISDKNRGPRKGCNYNRLTENFKVINSDFTKNYVDCEDCVTPEKASTYNYLDFPKTDFKENVIGGEICAWEYGNPAMNHYDLSFACTSTVLLDKLWNTDNVIFETDYRAALTKLILGTDTPNSYDMTELFDSIFPPRTNGKFTYLSKGATSDDDFLQNHLSALKKINTTYSPYFLEKLFEREFEDLKIEIVE